MLCAPIRHMDARGACAQAFKPDGPEILRQCFDDWLQSDRCLIPWGESVCAAMAPFPLKSAVVCGASVVKGIGRLLQMELIPVEGATGEVDTNLAGKVQAALLAAEQTPFVLLHINGADEAAHRRMRQKNERFCKKWIVSCWQSCWLPGTGSPWSVTMAPTRRPGSIGAVRSLITENKRRYKYAGTAAAAGKHPAAGCRCDGCGQKTTGRIGKAPGQFGEIGGAVRSGGRHYRTGIQSYLAHPSFGVCCR